MIKPIEATYPSSFPYELTNIGNSLQGLYITADFQMRETREKVRELCMAFNDLEKKLTNIIKAISEEADALSGVAPKTMAAVAALSADSIEKD